MRNFFILISTICAGITNALTSLSANAGADQYICPHIVTNLSGSASGGTGPYTYHWEPASLCSTPNAASTNASPTQSLFFTLTVIDAAGDTAQDVIAVYVNDIQYFGAGPDQGRCYLGGPAVTIGDQDNYQGNYTYSWLPVNDLSNPTAPKPLATPNVTTTFTVTITSPACGIVKDSVTVFVYKVNADAGPNDTINEGETYTLTGTGGTQYFWSPYVNIRYQNTDHPDVNPTLSQTYLLQTIDDHGCSGYDTVRVYVRPSNALIFYNTFTPNGDGNNDVWVIANLQKYPDNRLEIYNRYGQLVFKKNAYANDWSGSYFGEELPSGTYFYILDTNTDAGKFKGSVTIVR